MVYIFRKIDAELNKQKLKVDCINCYFWDLYCTLGNVFQRYCINYKHRHFKEKPKV